MHGMLQTISYPADDTKNRSGLPSIASATHLASVLLFGHDPRLLQTRSWVFQRNGCAAHTVTSEQEFRTEFLQHHPHVLLLCQTLSARECEAAASFAEEHGPNTRCILLYTRETGWSLDREHILLNSNEGPRHLVDTVRRVLESRANRESREDRESRTRPLAD